ncbi:TPA: WecB/TagA/CpsF family glycosyltransferase [Klebsiella quasipneumoniae subsp. quasipneumoniae]|uniref:WecB/TagA/CpsF family glycosyltransferase n=1 Tax=Klebsiella quasipneumoniae TaxID=1463165 RepID=UPI003CF22A68
MTNLKKFDTITINDVSMNDFLNIIHRNFLKKDASKIIVTPNIDHLQRLRNSDDSSFCKAYEISDYRLCDSRIVQKLSTFNKQTILNVVPGSDLTRELLKLDWVKSSRITIIGTTDKQVEHLKKLYQLHNIEHFNPSMGFVTRINEVEACVNFIINSNPDFVFLAVGSPSQEHLAFSLYQRINRQNPASFAAQLFCIGASLDFLTGKTKRAPIWMQKAHLEWLHRALSQPRRLVPRYYRNLKYVIWFLLLRNRS